MSSEKLDEAHLENVTSGNVQSPIEAAQILDAQRAASAEHSLGVMEAFRAYRKALLWSALVSMASSGLQNIVMESYDTILISTFYAYPTFKEKFGDRLPSGAYSIPAKWQSAISLAGTVGIIFGIYLNGFLVDRWGYKRLMIASLLVLTATIALVFAAVNREMLLVGQLLSGVPWGVLNVIAPAYAIETAPLALRHYTPTFVNMCWVLGHILGAGVLTGLVGNKTEWGWRIPFALQWVFPIPLLVAAFLCPESPWYLVRQGRRDDAIRSMKRLTDASVDQEQVVTLIAHTVELERNLNFGSSYISCFKGVDLRRTEIAVVCWVAQTLVGFTIQGYQTYFFTQAGMASSDAFKLTLGTYAIAGVGTLLAMPLQQRFPRKKIWLTGICCMLPVMLTVGILACLPQTPALLWAQGCVLLVWFFCYGWSVGPLPFVICAEIGSAQLRQKTIAIARSTYYIVLIVNTVAAPYVLNPTAANLKGKAAFIPSGLMVLLLIWSYYRLPESKGRSFEELDLMFARKVPARQFASYKVNTEDEFGKGAIKELAH